MTIRERFQRLRTVHVRGSLLLALVRAAGLAVAVALGLLALDLLLALGPISRFALDLAWVLLVLSAAAGTAWSSLRPASLERMLARKIEAAEPGLENDLVNALEFEAALAGGDPGDLSADLMKCELDRAAAEVDAVSTRSLRPATLPREGVLLGLSSGAAVAFALAFPGVLEMVVPRYLDPFGDHPPWSPFRIELEPGDARVAYGERVVVRARIEGGRPGRVELVVAEPGGAERTRAPMFEAPDGSHVQALEDVRDDLDYFVRIPDTWTRRSRISVAKTPRVESVSLAFEYPAYTRRRPRTRILSDGPVKVPAGTRVTLAVSSNRPLAGGAIEFAGAVHPMTPVEPRRVAGSFLVEAAGAFLARIADVDGLAPDRPVEGAFEIEPDLPPTPSIPRPGMDSLAVPDARIEVAIEAVDDFGVARIDFVRRVGEGEDASAAAFSDPEARSPFARAVETIDLAALGVAPGDEIEYYATATDARPGAPQTRSTASYRIRVISVEEWRELALAEMRAEDLRRQYQEVREALSELAARQEALDRALGDGGDPAVRAAEQREVLEAAGALGRELAERARAPAVFDIEAEYQREIEELEEKLEEARDAMDRAARALERGDLGAAGPESRRALEALREDLEAFDDSIGGAGEDLERLEDLLEDARRFEELVDRQERLERDARLLQDVSDLSFEDEVRLAELAEEERSIATDLERIREDLERHAAEAEGNSPEASAAARELAGEVEKRGIGKTMAEAAEALAGNRPRPGWEGAKKALAELESLCSECLGTGMGEGKEGKPAFGVTRLRGMELGGTLGQLSKGLRAGSRGLGTAGDTGGRVPHALHGPPLAGRPSRLARGGGSAEDRKAQEEPRQPRPAPFAFEEIEEEEDDPSAYSPPVTEPFVEEYRRLIEAYFRRVAEESK